jgi:hypothetical protein
MKLSAELEARIRYFCYQIEDLNQKEFPQSPATKVSYEIGRRYVRIVKHNSWDQKSVHSFIDSTNGDILKGSWKAPVARGVRGNIYADDHGLSCVNWHGPKYLR